MTNNINKIIYLIFKYFNLQIFKNVSYFTKLLLCFIGTKVRISNKAAIVNKPLRLLFEKNDITAYTATNIMEYFFIFLLSSLLNGLFSVPFGAHNAVNIIRTTYIGIKIHLSNVTISAILVPPMTMAPVDTRQPRLLSICIPPAKILKIPNAINIRHASLNIPRVYETNKMAEIINKSCRNTSTPNCIFIICISDLSVFLVSPATIFLAMASTLNAPPYLINILYIIFSKIDKKVVNVNLFVINAKSNGKNYDF